ncbi:hypothetical protein SFRURICE_009013 [Spodoptera frugiperda]|nr:hypothetical protein SFRURICE_009013 [Spodoptera frugiperda]
MTKFKSAHSGYGHFVKLAALQDVARAPSLAPRDVRHVATITEVCNSEEVPEVEIVSLLQEHIPKYRLRADSLTQFGGYENQDWFIPSPALPVSDKDLALTPDQIRETLNYFREYLLHDL